MRSIGLKARGRIRAYLIAVQFVFKFGAGENSRRTTQKYPFASCCSSTSGRSYANVTWTDFLAGAQTRKLVPLPSFSRFAPRDIRLKDERAAAF